MPTETGMDCAECGHGDYQHRGDGCHAPTSESRKGIALCLCSFFRTQEQIDAWRDVAFIADKLGNEGYPESADRLRRLLALYPV